MTRPQCSYLLRHRIFEAVWDTFPEAIRVLTCPCAATHDGIPWVWRRGQRVSMPRVQRAAAVVSAERPLAHILTHHRVIPGASTTIPNLLLSTAPRERGPEWAAFETDVLNHLPRATALFDEIDGRLFLERDKDDSGIVFTDAAGREVLLVLRLYEIHNHKYFVQMVRDAMTKLAIPVLPWLTH